MGLLEALIASGERVELHMEQVEILKANVEVRFFPLWWWFVFVRHHVLSCVIWLGASRRARMRGHSFHPLPLTAPACAPPLS